MSKRPRARLSHVSADGAARMVDVGDKPATPRQAVAEGFVRVSPELARLIRSGGVKKGPVLEVARLAGVLAAKRTDELIPLCHGLALEHVDVRATLERARVRLVATARTTGKTGVEMEALVAVALAALTVIDMGKAVDRAMVIEGVRLLSKKGGRSGDYHAPRRASK